MKKEFKILQNENINLRNQIKKLENKYIEDDRIVE